MTESRYPNPTWRYWWGRVDMVVASHGCDPDPFIRQLKPLLSSTGTETQNSWQSHGSWIFATYKTYNPHQISIIDSRLAALGSLCLRMNLKAAISWSLDLFGDGQKQFTYRHDFSLLHPRLLEEKQIHTLAKAYDDDLDAYMEDYELDIPANFQAEWSSLPFRDFHSRCIAWHRQTCLDAAARLSDLFQEYGVDGDRAQLAAILTATACTEPELEWYVGNLPRFLTAIGLGDVFWNWQTELRQLTSPSNEGRS
ncbi:MAG: hypothetical protein OHK0012_02280 [Synechococcales cyanobacterium]